MNKSFPLSKEVVNIFSTPITSLYQWGIIIFVGFAFIYMPQHHPIDWDLNTNGFWSEGLRMYQNPNRVYPPWGLILMVPYYLIRAEGARFFSVIVIGWLVQKRGWSLLKFFTIVLGPYFLVTMTKSNMDIFVLVLPMLLWESVEDTNWQTLGRGLALSILILKPQGAILIWFYLLWINRETWQEMVKPLLIVAALVIPTSLIGSPPLILQWLYNLSHPSPNNEYFWSINNISLSNYFSPITALIMLVVSFILLKSIMEWRGKPWRREHAIAGFLLLPMFLLPYASQQSFSSPLAFIPSWKSYLFQVFILFISFTFFEYWDYIPLLIFSIALVSMYFFDSDESTINIPKAP